MKQSSEVSLTGISESAERPSRKLLWNIVFSTSLRALHNVSHHK